MKRSLLWILVLVMSISMIAAFSLTSCKAPVEEAVPAEVEEAIPAEVEEVTEEPEAILIGASLPLGDSPFWVEMANGMEEEANKYGAEFLLIWAEEKIEKQVKDMEDMIQKGVSIILVAPIEPKGVNAVIEEADKAGIKTISCARKAESDLVLSWAGFDEYMVGISMGEWVAKRLGEEGGNVGFLSGQVAATSFAAIRDGLYEVLDQHPQIEVVMELSGKEDRATQMALTEDMLQANPQLDLIAASCDEQAIGAIQAVKAAGREDEIIVLSASGSGDVIEECHDLGILMVIDKNAKLIGISAVKLAIDYLKGVDVPKEYPVETPPIDLP